MTVPVQIVQQLATLNAELSDILAAAEAAQAAANRVALDAKYDDQATQAVTAAIRVLGDASAKLVNIQQIALTVRESAS